MQIKKYFLIKKIVFNEKMFNKKKQFTICRQKKNIKKIIFIKKLFLIIIKTMTSSKLCQRSRSLIFVTSRGCTGSFSVHLTRSVGKRRTPGSFSHALRLFPTLRVKLTLNAQYILYSYETKTARLSFSEKELVVHNRTLSYYFTSDIGTEFSQTLLLNYMTL